MDEVKITRLINRILSGYTFISKYIVDTPSVNILAEGDAVYDEFMFENRFEDMISRDQTDFLLMKNGLWSAYEQGVLDSLENKLNEAKLQLYLKGAVPSTWKKLKSHIETLNDEYSRLMGKKLALDHCTIEYLAEEQRDNHIFSKIVLNKYYKSIKIKPATLVKIVGQYKKNAISIKKYREIARSRTWSTIWGTSKISSFRRIGEEQRILISYAQLYDNIKKHSEPPSDAIVKDDDMLDGWMIHVNKENEREKKEDRLSKKKSNENHNEHFIMANTEEDVKSIMDMNDTRGKIVQKKIHNMTKTHGVANEYDITEIRQDAQVVNR